MVLNPIDVISHTFKELKDSYLHNFKLGLLVYFLPVIASYIFVYSFFPDVVVSESPSSAGLAGLVFITILTVILSFIILGAYLKGYRDSKPSTFSDGTSLAAKLFGVQFTQAAGFIVLGLVGFMLILRGAFDLSSIPAGVISATIPLAESINVSQTIFGVLIVCLTALTYFIFSIYWSVSTVEATDGKGVFTSIAGSFQLVKGQWWRTLAASILFGFMVVIGSIALLIISIPAALLAFISPVASAITSQIISEAFVTALLPVTASFVVSLHDGLSQD